MRAMDQTLSPSRDIELSIGGMTCASCVARVEKVLGRVPGVQAASVNLALERAHVTVSGEVGLEALAAAVERAGYSAVPVKSARPDASWREQIELMAAFLLAVPVVLDSMVMPVPPIVPLICATLVQFWLPARRARNPAR